MFCWIFWIDLSYSSGKDKNPADTILQGETELLHMSKPMEFSIVQAGSDSSRLPVGGRGQVSCTMCDLGCSINANHFIGSLS